MFELWEREFGCKNDCVDEWVKKASPLDDIDQEGIYRLTQSVDRLHKDRWILILKFDSSFNKQGSSKLAGSSDSMINKQKCYKIIDADCNGQQVVFVNLKFDITVPNS